jgi:hypothetical protein
MKQHDLFHILINHVEVIMVLDKTFNVYFKLNALEKIIYL